MNSCSWTLDVLPALDHLYVVLLVGNNAQLCQGLKQVVALQDQIPLKDQRAAQLLHLIWGLLVAASLYLLFDVITCNVKDQEVVAQVAD